MVILYLDRYATCMKSKEKNFIMADAAPLTGEIPKTYSPGEVEDTWYAQWERGDIFHAEPDPSKESYTIVIPPPNITGMLTMGHVLNNTLQDVFIRWHRMDGKNACWIPGTDHAGIATQTVVEKTLKVEEGKSRHDLGREKFIERVWLWREKFGSIIIQQLRKLGVSCDWNRTVFTMDEGLSYAVREAFIRLYKKGLIYRGKRIINWDPVSHTALSDEEVNHKPQKGKLYYFKYPLMMDGSPSTSQFLIVATTRPETMLGDTAVAVNPHDERYRKYISKSVLLPLTLREIPVIADEYVDASFGTGVVKITPAHDPNDFEVAQRHNLPSINVMDVDASINEFGGKYTGQDRFTARKNIVDDLTKLGLVEKIDDYEHSVGYSDRTDVPIEPYLSDQWFVRMEPLAKPALEVVRNGGIKFYPDRWVKTYENWMTNIRDWCISRQLWWGHRIPVYYCDSCGWQDALHDDPKHCPECSGQVREDEDVLDTWFSSWLWPFSVHQWPGDTADLRYFYPTNLLVTAPDIIFFWVARMIMAGLEFMSDIPKPDGSKRTEYKDLVPFRDVYFTSIIRDEKGRKMSKSLGNSPDPLDIIGRYGADALRFTVIYLAPLGQDVLFSTQKCELGRNFANKIWNAARFFLTKKNAIEDKGEWKFQNGHWIPKHGNSNLQLPMTSGKLELEDAWIFSQLNTTIESVKSSMENYRVNDAAKLLYDFIWHDYCDWYIELIKERIFSPDEKLQRVTLERALHVFDAILHLLHPFMPFLTEELWHRIESRDSAESISRSSLPTVNTQHIDYASVQTMTYLQQIVESVRAIRGEMNIPSARTCHAVINTSDELRRQIIDTNAHFLQRLAKIDTVEAGSGKTKPPFSAAAVVNGDDVFIPLEGLIDIGIEKKRLTKEITRIEGLLKGIESKLKNVNFMSSAPEEIIDREKEKFETFTRSREKLLMSLQSISGD